MTLADKIVVLRGGNIEQVGSPMDLYERPQNTFVAQFIGSPKMNFFNPSDLAGTAPAELRQVGEDTIIGIRSEHLSLCRAGEETLSATHQLVEHLGEHALVHCTTNAGTEFIAKLDVPPQSGRDEPLYLSVSPDRWHLFDRASGLRR